MYFNLDQYKIIKNDIKKYIKNENKYYLITEINYDSAKNYINSNKNNIVMKIENFEMKDLIDMKEKLNILKNKLIKIKKIKKIKKDDKIIFLNQPKYSLNNNFYTPIKLNLFKKNINDSNNMIHKTYDINKSNHKKVVINKELFRNNKNNKNLKTNDFDHFIKTLLF